MKARKFLNYLNKNNIQYDVYNVHGEPTKTLFIIPCGDINNSAIVRKYMQKNFEFLVEYEYTKDYEAYRVIIE